MKLNGVELEILFGRVEGTVLLVMHLPQAPSARLRRSSGEGSGNECPVLHVFSFPERSVKDSVAAGKRRDLAVAA